MSNTKSLRQLAISAAKELIKKNASSIRSVKDANAKFKEEFGKNRTVFKDEEKGSFDTPIKINNGKNKIYFNSHIWDSIKLKDVLEKMAKYMGTDLSHYGLNQKSSTQDAGELSSNSNQPSSYLEEPENEKKCEILQLIFYGAPGTGKSLRIKNLLENEITYRTTFHPDTDYATFVGCYKPSMDNKDIIYSFNPQVFLIAYLRAWYEYCSWLTKNSQNNNNDNKVVADGGNQQKPKRVYLIIEEINRGNCAQIFGDIFQLLDREEKGFSSYPIIPDQDIVAYIRKATTNVSGFLDKYNTLIKDIEEKKDSDVQEDSGNLEQVFNGLFSKTEMIKLAFPPNFHIWATMNTSDQSLYPMDSAFKRRWDWEYVKIDTEHEEIKDVNLKLGSEEFPWPQVMAKINEKIKEMLHSADKQIGEFFIKCKKGQTIIDFGPFRDKVLFYLFNDVFKDNKKFGDEFFNDSAHYLYEDLLAMKPDKQEETVSRWLKERLDLSVKGSKTQLQQRDNDTESEQKGSDINVETTES